MTIMDPKDAVVEALSQSPNCAVCDGKIDPKAPGQFICSKECAYAFITKVAQVARDSGMDFQESLEIFRAAYDANRPQ